MNICNLCNKEFKLKHHLTQHQNRKIPCNRVIKCNRCQKEFKLKHHLVQHLNRKNPCEKVDLEQEVKKLKEENEKLKLEKENKILNQTINNNTNTNSNNTQNIFFIDKWDKFFYNQALESCFSKENLKHKGLDKILNEQIRKTESFKDTRDNLNLHKEYDRMNMYNHIKTGKNIYMHIIKFVCINMKYPENWIFIYNKLTEEVSVKVNDKFVELNNSLLRIIYDILKTLVEDENIDNNLRNIYKTFIERYETNYEPLEDFKEEYEEELNIFIERSEKEILDALKNLERELIQKIKDRNKNIEIKN